LGYIVPKSEIDAPSFVDVSRITLDERTLDQSFSPFFTPTMPNIILSPEEIIPSQHAVSLTNQLPRQTPCAPANQHHMFAPAIDEWLSVNSEAR
jgi:hypothetical protein